MKTFLLLSSIFFSTFSSAEDVSGWISCDGLSARIEVREGLSLPNPNGVTAVDAKVDLNGDRKYGDFEGYYQWRDQGKSIKINFLSVTRKVGHDVIDVRIDFNTGTGTASYYNYFDEQGTVQTHALKNCAHPKLPGSNET